MKRKYFHEIIQYWGFEHPFTIEFATAIENGASDAKLAALYEDIIDRDDEIDDEIADEWRDEIAFTRAS